MKQFIRVVTGIDEVPPSADFEDIRVEWITHPGRRSLNRIHRKLTYVNTVNMYVDSL